MPRKIVWPLAAGVLAVSLSLACALLPATPSPESLETAIAATLTALPPAASAPALPEAATPTQPAATPAPPAIALTATPTLPPAPLPAAQCPAPGIPPPIAAQADFAAYSPAVLAYLNAGGSPTTLAQSLQSIGAADPAGGVQSDDLTGDTTPEVIVALLDPQSISAGPVPSGQVLIFTCGGGQVQLAYDSGVSPEFTGPAIETIQDVTHDGWNDLLYTISTCGASTCFKTLYVIAWNGSSFANVVKGDTTQSFAKITLVPGANPGETDIEMYGGAAGSVGAGPPRQYTNVWGWDGSAIVLVETRLDPPAYRFHALNDADAAAKSGDHPTALALYDRVIHDDGLLGWEAVADERAHLSAYALFRTMVSRYALGDAAGAQAAYADLQAQFPGGTPGSEWVPVADTFNAAYPPAGDLHAGCAGVIPYLDATPDVLAPFANYGYANQTYTAPDTCPF